MIRLNGTDGIEVLLNNSCIEAVRSIEGKTAIYLIQAPKIPFYIKESLEQIEDMILRDQFAMSAMNGLQSVYWDSVDYYDSAEHLVKCMTESSYQIADAMLKQRKEK